MHRGGLRVLVVGSGGREHALCWKLKQSPRISRLMCAPGNPGIGAVAECIPLAAMAISELVNFAVREAVDLVVVGPEQPLEAGLADELRSRGISVWGPSAAAARLESSKAFAKEVLCAAGVPTADAVVVNGEAEVRRVVSEWGIPIVLKADGLAGGKGVVVCHSAADVDRGCEHLFKVLGATRVVIERFLSGVEVSFIVATDGVRVVPLATSHDYKRLCDRDQGPNTGGMGTVSPTPRLTRQGEAAVVESVIRPVLAEMARRGTPFQGFLYAGLMVGARGELNVIEFNCRCGDPETQVIMRRLASDLVDLLIPLSAGEAPPTARWVEETAVCVVLAAAGYPDNPRRGDRIEGIEFARQIPSIEVFHAGTERASDGSLIVSGGRVLNVTALGADREEARRRAYRGVDMVQFAGVQVRRDIGLN